ncbi:hypothetical protein T484DRAFT_1760089, partial [Baffinella frigidus]
GDPKNVDFAGSDSILKSAQYEAYPDLQMYPAVAGAVVAIYNFPELAVEGLPLVLRTSTVAKIFSGAISVW